MKASEARWEEMALELSYGGCIAVVWQRCPRESVSLAGPRAETEKG